MPYLGYTSGNSSQASDSSSDSGSWWDTISGGISDAADWYGRNEKTIGGLVNAGRSIYNAYDASQSRNNARSQIADVYSSLMQKEMDYATQMRAYQEQQLALQNANAGARSAAAAATDRNRREAARKALAVQKKMLRQLQDNYAPYVEAAKSITPRATQNYNQFLDTTSLLNQYLTPVVMKGASDPLQPASSFAAPRPAVRLSQPQSTTIDNNLMQRLLGGG